MDFIVVKSTFDVTPLYNDQQDSLYPEGTPETVQETSELQPLKRTTADQTLKPQFTLRKCTLGD